ncbi:hypothetical protein [Phytohabitans aurantiacus]|uniref:Transmembrane protein n=1 Tax=Phytohabitans aurantiacus TaxID=3016789 RepID=A0ABQ5QS86_9ACTN|nr:hypothetical protein [Phytohabitans aurantiacus]GLH96569.1 hypothetical protein Pa4123_18430 [Phytohabitans aurantiacus]
MTWSKWIRQFHRWVAIAFTASVVLVTVVVLTQDEPAEWVYLSPLLPLFLLICTGLYLFALPYLTRRRALDTR